MSYTSLAELDRRSITFPGPSLRMAGLEAALVAIEEQLEQLKGQRAVRLYARLKREAHLMHHEDIEYELSQLKNAVEELFPKVFRGGFVISLWSVFEACTKDLAEYVRREKSFPFALQDLRAGDFLEQVEKFFASVLGLKAFPDKSVRAKLEQLRGLRNCLAHHDGNEAELPKSLRGKSEAEYKEKGLILYSDLHHTFVIPTDWYTEQILETVRTYLVEFADRVYESLHPFPLSDEI